jgi:hypothetical protein
MGIATILAAKKVGAAAAGDVDPDSKANVVSR